MPGTPEQRDELAHLLRARRDKLPRSPLGLPDRRGGHAHGLSREEVAVLSGMSGTWYTWLEQGRDINPSRQVLDALARVLSLTPTEHAYVLELTGYAAGPVTGRPSPAELGLPDHLQRLLDGLAAFPAFALAADWRILGWNRAYERLYPSITAVAAADRNLLRLVFTDPGLRELLPHWAADSRHFVAEFRADAGPRLADPAHQAVVAGLRAASPEFDALWQDHEVERFATRERWFRHHEVGDLVFEHQRLFPTDGPGLHLVVYVPAPGHGTEERLARLLAD